MLIKNLIKNEYQVIAVMYDHCDGVIIFTVPNWDRRTVYKCDMKPHYVLCSVDKLKLLLYSCDDYCGGSALLQHWSALPKILKENNIKRALVEAKKQNYFKTICKGK